ncbi:hypothetical protein SLEP1_g53254 [Rubroshorea leprosula]|uniref:Uncharacterized protein n=1 Tax=Rubroshorea leprosula TaxID=152421 RepID=A0AAV5M8V2_9ROSI|nr:hypothetical protein SLEP1_g53254 [Rubroshorea leprosula]
MQKLLCNTTYYNRPVQFCQKWLLNSTKMTNSQLHFAFHLLPFVRICL